MFISSWRICMCIPCFFLIQSTTIAFSFWIAIIFNTREPWRTIIRLYVDFLKKSIRTSRNGFTAWKSGMHVRWIIVSVRRFPWWSDIISSRNAIIEIVITLNLFTHSVFISHRYWTLFGTGSQTWYETEVTRTGKAVLLLGILYLLQQFVVAFI